MYNVLTFRVLTVERVFLLAQLFIVMTFTITSRTKLLSGLLSILTGMGLTAGVLCG